MKSPFKSVVSIGCILSILMPSVAQADESWLKAVNNLSVIANYVKENPRRIISGIPKTGQDLETFNTLIEQQEGSTDIKALCGTKTLENCTLLNASKLLNAKTVEGAAVFGLVNGAMLELDLAGVTSVWANDDVRNSFDKFKEWTDAIAPIVMIVGSVFLASQDSSSKRENGGYITAGGGGIFLLGNLLQTFAGANETKNKDKLNNTIKIMEEVSMSREAYSDAKIRYAFLDDAAKSATESLEKMAKLGLVGNDLLGNALSENPPAQANLVKEFANNTLSIVDKFAHTSNVANKYAIDLESYYSKYHNMVSDEKTKKEIEKSRIRAAKFMAEYGTILSLYVGKMPEVNDNLRILIDALTVAGSPIPAPAP